MTETQVAEFVQCMEEASNVSVTVEGTHAVTVTYPAADRGANIGKSVSSVSRSPPLFALKLQLGDSDSATVVKYSSEPQAFIDTPCKYGA
jgi:hypothetical protein